MAKCPTAPLPLDDPFYRPATIADRTGRHPETIRQAIRRGDIKGTRIGKRAIAVRASEVQRWLDSLNAPRPEGKPNEEAGAAEG
jgi:excisionase family DNA binding protein